MKKIFLIGLLITCFTTTYASSTFISDNSLEQSVGRRYKRGYYKGNVSPENLPSSITRYLKKHYSDYEIVISKRKGNDYYYLKIAYGGNAYRSYYRSLVFDENGDVVKG